MSLFQYNKMTTIDELIKMLIAQKIKHGGKSKVCIEGFDPCKIKAEDVPEEDKAEYNNAQTWVVT